MQFSSFFVRITSNSISVIIIDATKKCNNSADTYTFTRSYDRPVLYKHTHIHTHVLVCVCVTSVVFLLIHMQSFSHMCIKIWCGIENVQKKLNSTRASSLTVGHRIELWILLASGLQPENVIFPFIWFYEHPSSAKYGRLACRYLLWKYLVTQQIVVN